MNTTDILVKSMSHIFLKVESGNFYVVVLNQVFFAPQGIFGNM